MNRFTRTRAAGQTDASVSINTVLATTVAPGSTVSSNPVTGQLIDGSGRVIVDASGVPLTSLAQLVAATGGAAAAPAATAGLVAIPVFGADGNALIGADGKPATQMVPTGSPAAMALAKSGWMRGGWGMLWAGLGIAAVTYFGAYWGAKMAMRKARARMGEARSKRSRRSSRRVSVVG